MKPNAVERTPLVGHEVEAAMVKAEALAKLRGLESFADLQLGNGNRNGLFSKSLVGDLRSLVEQATDALALLERMRALHGEKEKPKRESTLDRWRRSLTGVELEAVHAVERAEARKAVARRQSAAVSDPDRCPQCGGSTKGCRADGTAKHLQNRWVEPGSRFPARLCDGCGAVTQNLAPIADAGSAKVIQLFGDPRD